MKKLILSLIAVAVGTLSSFAQSDLVATLSHGSSLSTFSGIDALAQAYEAAVEGDVITLSPGVFNAVNIEKAITVRGAGMQPMESNGYVTTQIVGEISVNIPQDASSALTIEGVNLLSSIVINGENLAKVNLSKSRFEQIVTGNGIQMNAISCIFAHSLESRAGYHPNYKNTILYLLNSVIISASSSYVVSNGKGFIGKIIATNSIIGANSLHYDNLINCIINSRTYLLNNEPLPQTCNAQNCIGINTDGATPNLFQDIQNPSNIMVEGSGETAYASLFKTFRGNAQKMTETFELTETAAATYLGDDGTQVGIYGGTNPFNPTPTNPQVKKFTVNSTTEGDQLKVKINVE